MPTAVGCTGNGDADGDADADGNAAAGGDAGNGEADVDGDADADGDASQTGCCHNRWSQPQNGGARRAVVEQLMPCLGHSSPAPCLFPAYGRTPSARRGAQPSPMPCGPTAPSGSWSKSHGPQEGTHAAARCHWSCPKLCICDLHSLSLASSLAANLLYDEGGKAIAFAMKENRALTSLQ